MTAETESVRIVSLPVEIKTKQTRMREKKKYEEHISNETFDHIYRFAVTLLPQRVKASRDESPYRVKCSESSRSTRTRSYTFFSSLKSYVAMYANYHNTSDAIQ